MREKKKKSHGTRNPSHSISCDISKKNLISWDGIVPIPFGALVHLLPALEEKKIITSSLKRSDVIKFVYY